VINNICNDNNDGIAVVSAADSRISGNRCDSNTSYGINLQVENIRIIISNNNCSSNGIDGINLWPTGGNPIDNCIIECNICYDNTGWGINIRNADASATIVSGNILIDNTGGEFNNLGTDTQIGHNITS